MGGIDMKTETQTKRVGRAALSIVAVGLTAGIALIAAAKKVGDTYFTDNEEAPEDEDEDR